MEKRRCCEDGAVTTRRAIKTTAHTDLQRRHVATLGQMLQMIPAVWGDVEPAGCLRVCPGSCTQFVVLGSLLFEALLGDKSKPREKVKERQREKKER